MYSSYSAIMKIIEVEGLKEIQLEMLKEIDRFCKENSLRYSLAFGSLLGAVRHKGYIPWDDDLDIMLLRKDYDIFVKNFRHEYYSVIEPDNDDDYSLPFAKVNDTRTVINEYANVKNLYGVYIDIFPIDNVPDDINELNLFLEEKERLNKQHILKIVPLRWNRNPLKNIILMIGQVFLSFKSIHTISKEMSELSSKYSSLEKCKMKGIIAPDDNRREELLPSEYFESYITLPFEGFNAMVIEKYHEYLTASYGNYMQFPPKDKQLSHHRFEAWWKQ